MKLRILFLLVGFCAFHISLAQVDSIIFKNNNYIVGEIKSLDKGVFTIETDYSDSDFKIEWSGIKEMYTETYFLITLTEGSRYNGRIKSTGENKITIKTNDGQEIEISHEELVFLKAVDSGFWSQFYASIDFGFNYAKSSNLQQLSIRSNLGYIAERWSTGLSFSTVNSTQDEIDPVKRTEIGITYRYALPKDWYVLVNMSFLSNTEQKLDLRSNGKTGLGKYLVHTNRKYWSFQAGTSFNNEKFSTETTNQQSLEGYFGTELNLFDIGDFSLLTNANAYPGITENKRWRADFKIDVKYDLPLDFYLKAGYSLNYDNQPVEGAAETDYVFQTTVGWEL